LDLENEAKSRMAAWRKGLPPVPYLAVGVVIVLGIIAWDLSGGAEGAQRICNQIVSDLGRFQPFTLIGTYFAGMPCSGWNTGLECAIGGAVSFLDPGKGIGRFFIVMGQALQESGTPGRIIFPLSLLAALPIAFLAVGWFFRKVFGYRGLNPFLIALSLVLVPFGASCIALVLQILAVVLFSVLGAVLGLIVWTLATFGGLIACWRLGQDVIEWGRRAHEAVEAIRKL
jgi:hypothetical protein